MKIKVPMRSSPHRATFHRTGTRFVKECFLCCTAPKSPLCKGRWAAERRLGGVVNPSVSFADSSLYTRGAFSLLSYIAQHHRRSRWWVSVPLRDKNVENIYFTSFFLERRTNPTDTATYMYPDPIKWNILSKYWMDTV